MKSYTVRIEIAVKSMDFAEITVLANTPADARELAAKRYNEGNLELDYWSSDYLDSELDTEYQDDWQVDEVE